MKTQRDEILRVLTSHGWRSVDHDRSEPGWWADEVVVLESTWAPVGAAAYVTFVVDPMHDGQRAPGEAVWACTATRQRPATRDDLAEQPTLSLGQGWNDRLTTFVDQVNAFRTVTP